MLRLKFPLAPLKTGGTSWYPLSAAEKLPGKITASAYAAPKKTAGRANRTKLSRGFFIAISF
jgi:hypothetical protein